MISTMEGDRCSLTNDATGRGVDWFKLSQFNQPALIMNQVQEKLKGIPYINKERQSTKGTPETGGTTGRAREVSRTSSQGNQLL